MTVGMTVAGGGPGEELQRYRILGRKANISHFGDGLVNYFPGDEVLVKASVIAEAVAMGWAELIVPDDDPDDDPDEVRNDDPVVETRDPVKAKRGRKTRRR